MDPRLEALEAAKLAAMVSSQLKKVDQLTVERSGQSANKINIQEFISSVQNPNFKIQNKFDQIVPSGFAPPPSEHLIRQMVPDVQQTILPHQQPSQVQEATTSATFELPKSAQKQKNVKILNVEKDEATFKNIEKSLKSISKTLDNMLKLLQEKYKNE